MDYKERVEELVRRAKLEEAINVLINLTNIDDNKKNDFNQISFWFHQVKNSKIKGLLSDHDYQTSLNKISENIVQLG